MLCIGVFVDAGYLFAQGSVALTGSKKPRSLVALNISAAIAELLSFAEAKTGGAPLLRIYWYDASPAGGLSTDHVRLAYTDSIKLRLGQINSVGQQKGVDSLIVTDLIELARNRAITDAVLLSGDEDVRIGVTIAQSYGVRIHLLGIQPSRGSQSRNLLQEADTTTEWDRERISTFLSVEPSSIAASDPRAGSTDNQTASRLIATSPALVAVAEAECASLSASDRVGLIMFWETENGVPPEFDGRLLAKSRDAIGRVLDATERRAVRRAFKDFVLGHTMPPA